MEKVQRLRECLTREDTREEAAGIIRGLVDEIRLHPIDGALQIELKPLYSDNAANYHRTMEETLQHEEAA